MTWVSSVKNVVKRKKKQYTSVIYAKMQEIISNPELILEIENGAISASPKQLFNQILCIERGRSIGTKAVL